MFWRMRGIELSDQIAAQEWLREQTEELAVDGGSGYSLAADVRGKLCATLTSLRQPTPPTEKKWTLDSEFIGLTPLSSPENANVDIVAITGLGGHALGSFRSTDGASVWLRDFAPSDIPSARLITYGYHTKVVDSHSNQGVDDLGRTLLGDLANFRIQTQTPQKRPILFLCHSLGGVVLKKALIISGQAKNPEHEHLRGVVAHTYGLVFMGVPNLGMRQSQLAAVVKGKPNENFIRDLLVQQDSEASQFLRDLTRDFSRLDGERASPFRIISYFETLESSTIKVDSITCYLCCRHLF